MRGMGTNLRDQMANVVNQLTPASEERPLLRSFPNPSGYGSNHTPMLQRKEISASAKVKDYLAAEVDTRWAELILIVCFFISGMIDAGAYNAYECFVSMQVRSSLKLVSSTALIGLIDRQYRLRGPWSLGSPSSISPPRLDQISRLRLLILAWGIVCRCFPPQIRGT
jgi:hypothetical protein